MAQREIVISFDKMGNSKVDAQNFVGASCAEATKVFEQALGGQQKDEKKPEYYQPESTGVEQSARW